MNEYFICILIERELHIQFQVSIVFVLLHRLMKTNHFIKNKFKNYE